MSSKYKFCNYFKAVKNGLPVGGARRTSRLDCQRHNPQPFSQRFEAFIRLNHNCV
jgi:hypothetical protein